MTTRLSRPSAAATLVVAVAIGLAAPAATAAAAGPVRNVQTTKVTKSDRLLETARRQVVREAARKDTALIRVRCVGVGTDAVAVLRSSIGSDRVLLQQLGADAHAAITLAEVRTVATRVRLVRPEVYTVVVGQLREIVELTAEADGHTAALDDLQGEITGRELAGEDLTTLREALAEARLHNAEAVLALPVVRDAALMLTATSGRALLETVTTEVSRIADVLDEVANAVLTIEAALAAPVDEETLLVS